MYYNSDLLHKPPHDCRLSNTLKQVRLFQKSNSVRPFTFYYLIITESFILKLNTRQLYFSPFWCKKTFSKNKPKQINNYNNSQIALFHTGIFSQIKLQFYKVTVSILNSMIPIA